MSWAHDAANSLGPPLMRNLEPGTEVAAAAVDAAETVTVGPAGRFEIGSVTKTMTATVLALLIGEGALSLDDEIGRWLAAGRNGAITVRELATHTSGLPAAAPNMRPDPRDPWAGFGFAEAEEGLRLAGVTPGNPWRYSNLGYHLLALVLTRVTGQDYATLLGERLFAPLDMAHSGVRSLGAGTLVPGHADGHEVPRLTHPLGAGGVESTIEDMAGYARVNLHPPESALGTAIALAQTPVLRVGDDVGQALGWQVSGGIRSHTGGTGGFCACVAVDRDHGRAVAILASSKGSPARSTYVRQAARLALAGEDPTTAKPVDPWPSWREDAIALARALVDGDIDTVHARLAPQARARIPRANLERVWANRIRPAGPADDITITHDEVAATGAIVVDLTITYQAGTQRIRTIVLPTGDIGGLSVQ